jgi:membrane associated rhomboid family serine protease
MSTQPNDLLEILLRECAAAQPQPWYPADYVNQTGVPRERVDADLDRLRLGGLLQLTDWVQGKGQGYVLTSAGVQVLENPRLLQRLRQYGVEPQPAPPPLRQVETRTTTWDRGERIRNALIDPGRPVVTMLLILANVLVFLVGAYMARQEDPALVGPYFSGSSTAQVWKIQFRLGGLNRPSVVAKNEWWRLLGYSFVHSGLFPHLLMNMLSLWMLGRFTEAMFGSARYLALYLVSGLGGGCAVALDPQMMVVGASGCVCGLLGAAGMWVFLNRRHLPQAFVARFFRAFGTNVLLLVFISMLPRVSWLGHLGGALAGAAIAVPLVYSRFGVGWQRWAGNLASLAIPLACVAVVFLSITDSERARRLLVDVERLSNSTYKRYALPIVEEKPDEHHKNETVKAAEQAFSDTQQRLRSFAQQLQRISPSDPRLKETLPIAKDYVAAWQTYFETLSKMLNERDTLSPRDREQLEQLHERTQTLTRKLNEAPLFSRNRKEGE